MHEAAWLPDACRYSHPTTSFFPAHEVGTHLWATVQRTVAQLPLGTSGQAVWQRISEDSKRAPTWRNDGGTDRKGETP